MTSKETSLVLREEKKRLMKNFSNPDALSRDELKEVFRYAARLADLYEMYIISKGIRYIWEADDYVQTHKGADYPLL